MQAADQTTDGRSQQAEAMRPLRILVADDSPFNQQVAAGLLELQGHTVRLAGDGREAIELYQQETFDIIFMDVEMPEIDGLAATQRIRELEQVDGQRTSRSWGCRPMHWLDSASDAWRRAWTRTSPSQSRPKNCTAHSHLVDAIRPKKGCPHWHRNNRLYLRSKWRICI